MASIRPAALSIITYPDPRLRVRCKAVARVTDEIRRIAERMIAIMRDEKGVGLAAPQVGLDLRLFVCQRPDDAEASVYVNPKLTLAEERVAADEGCLSLPEVTVSMSRARACMMEALDLEGRSIRVEGVDLLARIWQHETDHLDGRLIIDRMSEAEKIANKRIIRELEQAYEKANTRKRR